MDETTVECDVLVRRNLLRHLKEKTIEEKSTILYATHVFDGKIRLGLFRFTLINLNRQKNRNGKLADSFDACEWRADFGAEAGGD